ncbi:hypothetical protein BDY24DRAFT_371693 [Mrakia frigida]|uniref:uncharacterized protein n=1 Tax=Mrakia frigida TaxID=29902 RepID=UPI003FCC029D
MADSTNILLVFVHGFKGDDSTFKKFPERVNHIVQETFTESVIVESIVFPAYETKGDLGAATDAFIDWLASLTVEKENGEGLGRGAGKARIVLCGHSMGGLLAADALLKIARSRPDVSSFLWPRIIGLIAFDTPFLGLHPSVFKHTFTKATTHVTQAKEVASSLSILAPAFLAYTFGSKSKSTNPPLPTTTAQAHPPTEAPVREYFDPFGTGGVESGGDTHFTHEPTVPERRRSSADKNKDDGTTRRGSASSLQPTPKMVPASGGSAWSRFSTPALFGLGTAAVAAAAAGAYVKRNDVGLGLNWAQDHLRFIGNLWDGDQMKARLEGIEGMVEDEGIIFRNYYTLLPQTKGYLLPRTFCVLPQPGGPTRGLWVSAKNSVAKSEVDAHCEMFAPLSNDNYFDLGLRVAETISLAITQSRRRDSVSVSVVPIPLPSSHHHKRSSTSSSSSPSTINDVYARRPSVALSPNLGGSTYASAGGVGGTSRRKASFVPGTELFNSTAMSTGLGIGIGEFGAKAEERRASEIDQGLGAHDEREEEEGESDADTIRKGKMPGNAGGRRGSGMRLDLAGQREAEVVGGGGGGEGLRRRTSEGERREMGRPVAGTPQVEDEDPLSRVPVLVSL